tara:strand:+ start:2483 stop:2866 length:384 start_codon:yes stop_codon:yes gene_type:complete
MKIINNPMEEDVFLNISEPAFVVLLIVVFLAMIVITIMINRYLSSLENRLPEWAFTLLDAIGPILYSKGSELYFDIVEDAKEKAESTPNELDDELVELIDDNGRRVLVKIVEVFDEDFGIDLDQDNG